MVRKIAVHGWVGFILLLLILSLLFLPNLTSYGVMTPWEMDRVTVAIGLATDPTKQWMEVQHVEGEGDVAPMPLWVAAIGFKLFGISEAGGRIPSLVLFFLSIATLFWCVWRLVGTRAAYFSAIALAVFPVAGVHVLQIGGHGITASLLTIALSTIALARWWRSGWADRRDLAPERIGALVLGTAALTGCYFSVGGIVGLLLPVGAVTIAQFLSGDWRLVVPRRARELIAKEGPVSVALSLLFTITFIVLLILIVPAAVSKEPAFNLLAGGTPRVGAVPTIDHYLEHIAYGLYPWGALLPAGLAALLIPRLIAGSPNGGGEEEKLEPARIYFLVANFLGFAAISFYSFRFTNIPYVIVAPAAVACGILLYELERSKQSWKGIGIFSCLLLLIFLRDLRLYPDAMAEIWTSQTLKDGFPTKLIKKEHLSLFTLIFMAVVFYVFLQGSRSLKFLEWFGPEISILKALRGRYGRGWRIASFCLLGAWGVVLISAALIVLKVPIPPFNLLTSIARNAVYGLAALPVAILVCDFLYRLVYNAFASAQILRVDLLTATAYFFGFWFFNGYLPEVTRNLSPTSAISFYKEHAKEGEELLTYRIRAEIGKFFGLKKVREVTSQSALLREMGEKKRSFVLYGREDNPSLNLAYKEQYRNHLYVPEARSWRFLLASSIPIAGIKQANPIQKMVRLVPPDPEYHVYANLDNKVEYLGYDLHTENEGDWAGPLEYFTLTTYWHCTAKIPGTYQFFIHVDGFGLRLNGDHDPLDGLYPTRYWRPGDYLVDTHRMQVPIHFRAGNYTIYLGLFQGEERLKQIAGPTSGDNRIEGGILRVR